MATNPMNPDDIKAGDRVRLKRDIEDGKDLVYTVTSVGGSHGNKVLCDGLRRGELYASCFEKVKE